MSGVTLTPPLIYSSDVEEICSNAVALSRSAQVASSMHMRPTSSERKAALKVIVEFARERGRIIYGGYAIHTLLVASDKEGLYNDDDDYIDVEFYSPTPLEDVAELCMTLSRNHEFVRGKEAQHDSTFTISIEFVRMCDVTFVPESIYHKIPCVEAVPKSKVVHPQFAKLDIMNMLCDPFNSHWRLEYVVRRMLLIEQNFTSETNWVESGLRIVEQDHPNPPVNGPAASCNDDHLLVFRARALARAFFASRSSRCVMVGGCALDHFMNALSPPSDNHHVAEECDVSVMCTSAFIEDITALRAALTDLTPDTEWRAFRPLLGLLDGRSEVSLNGHIIAIAFDSHTRVVPSCGFMTLNDGRPDEVCLRVASFTQTLLNARALQIACEWEGYSMRSDAQQELCTRLIVARDNARNEAMQETTASASPWSLLCPDNVFRDFYLDYVGQPQHPMRVHMGRTNERIANAPSDSAWFSFDPHHTHQRPHGKHVNANSNSKCNSNLRVGKRTFARVDGSLDVGGSIPACAASTK